MKKHFFLFPKVREEIWYNRLTREIEAEEEKSIKQLCDDNQWPLSQCYVHNALIGLYGACGGANSLLHQSKCKSSWLVFLRRLLVHVYPRKETWSPFPVFPFFFFLWNGDDM